MLETTGDAAVWLGSAEGEPRPFARSVPSRKAVEPRKKTDEHTPGPQCPVCITPGPSGIVGPKSTRAVTIALALVIAAGLAAIPAWKFAAAQTKVSRTPGQAVPDFGLRDVRTGHVLRLSDHQAHIIVVVFSGSRWRFADTYLPRLSAFAADGEMHKVYYVAINADASDTVDDAVDQARALRVRFPMLKDSENRVADLLSAERLGEALVIDASGRLRYRGAIDDQFSSEPPRDKPSCNYLLNAIDAVIAGKAVSPDLTPVAGPAISRATGQ
jgi:hypothetical protein